MATTYVWSDERQCMVAEAVHLIEQELSDEQKYGDTAVSVGALLPQHFAEPKRRGRKAAFDPGPNAVSVTSQVPAEHVEALLKRYNTTNKSYALYMAVCELLK